MLEHMVDLLLFIFIGKYVCLTINLPILLDLICVGTKRWRSHPTVQILRIENHKLLWNPRSPILEACPEGCPCWFVEMSLKKCWQSMANFSNWKYLTIKRGWKIPKLWSFLVMVMVVGWVISYLNGQPWLLASYIIPSLSISLNKNTPGLGLHELNTFHQGCVNSIVVLLGTKKRVAFSLV